jgi:hypothetical protein
MAKQPPLGLSFPPDLSDEAAYEILEFLEALSLVLSLRFFHR